VLSDQERAELTVNARSRSLPASDVQRARVILLLAEGNSYRVVADKLGCSQTTVGLWRRRFLEEGLEGLYGRHHGSRKSSESQRLEAKILALTQKKPADGSTHWSTRKLAQVLGVSHMRVARVWSRAGLKPHRLDRYVASNDPDFETKAADVIGLYVNPPQHAAIFSVDESRRSRPSIAPFQHCPSPPAAPNGMGSNTSAAARSRCMPRSTREPVR
jgi:transposase